MLPLEANEIDVTMVRGFVAQVQSTGVSAFTVRGYTQVVKGLYTWLAEEGYIESNPLDRLKLPKTPKYTVQPLEEDEVRALLKAVNPRKRNGARDLSLILLLLDTGLRLGEVERLSLVDATNAMREGMLKVFGKGSRERHVPVGSAVQASLRRYIDLHRGSRPGTLYLGRESLPLTSEGLRQIIERRAKDAGVPGVHPHRLRHTFAVMFLRRGGDSLRVQRMLGHSSLEMTRNYVQLVYEDLKDAHVKSSPADWLYKK